MAKGRSTELARARGRPRSGVGEQVSARRLAKFAGVTPATVDEWLEAGLPAERDGTGPWRINTATAIRWLEQRAKDSIAASSARDEPLSMVQAELRKAIADAELAELKLARLRGELVPVEDFGKELRRVLGRVRARINAVPGEFAPKILEPLDMARATLTLRELTAALLRELQRAGDTPPDAAVDGSQLTAAG